MVHFVRKQRFAAYLALELCGLGLIAGCGGGVETGEPSVNSAVISDTGVSDVTAGTTQSGAAVQSPGSGLVTASIPSPESTSAENQTGGAQGAAPKPEPVDEVTAMLRRAHQLRIAPVTGTAEEEKKVRRSRNEEVVELSTKVLKLTMNDKEKEPQFNQAIGQLLEARFQMALSGTQEDVEQFYADVQALNDRDPKSAAAAEGVYRIARFVHTKAGLLGKTQPVWFEQLSRWAREFAQRFPEYGQKPGQISPAVTLLFGAARSCELHAAGADPELSGRLMTEAKLCYTAMAQDFSKTPQGQEAAAVLRRMAVVGQPLSQFSGPTMDGGMVSADEFAGKPTLIYFWASDESEFGSELLPILQEISAKVPGDRLRLIGVALDEEETELEQYMERTKVPGQQIFFPNREQRSWASPLVRYWGITRCPSVWLVDRSGVVVTTTVSASDLKSAVSKLLK
jgi:thiol-disulfide isomerase/thioredoxin